MGKEIKVRGMFQRQRKEQSLYRKTGEATEKLQERLGEVTKGTLATRKQNVNRFSISEDFSVQKNIYMQGEIRNDRWFNRFSYSFSSTRSLPYLSTVTAVYDDLRASVSDAL